MRPRAPALLLAAACAALALGACETPPLTDYAGGDDLAGLPDAPTVPPAWTAEAVWYQIFPERFRNGDPSNDPTPESMEGAWPQVGADSLRLVGWAPQDWTGDWYAQADWERRLRPGDFYVTAQLRRYGGDLQGVLDALGYLDSLGVTALYLNPVNDSPSLHKYDARSYHHVDPHFGPDPAGDREKMALEDPADPETWSTTAADGLLLDLVEAAHARGMRVVLDYSFNHTGTQFWAFQDVLENGPESPYADWYAVDAWDDPATPEDEFAYRGWVGVPELPELRKVDVVGDPEHGVPLDGDLAPGPKDHALAVALRWLDPDGDGDPSDGVDGFRLDVAEQVPLGFWRDLRRVVKAVNPEAALIGEIWWQKWPESLADPAPYLGDAFDSVMHYRPFPPLRELLDPSGPRLTPGGAARQLAEIYAGVPASILPSLMTMSGSHDTPRLSTTMANAGVPYKNEETPRNRPGYDVSRPDAAAAQAARLFRMLQVTLPGAPQVYYGDEVGMWGADDPDNRKPMVWPGRRYAAEASSPDTTVVRRPDRVAADADLLDFTRRALALRRAHPDLFARGTLVWQPTDAVLQFTRRAEGQAAVVAVNVSDEPQTVAVPARASLALSVGPVPARIDAAATLAPGAGAVFFVDEGRP